MKTSTTVYLTILAAALAAWMLLRGHGPGDLGGHLLFDWSNRVTEKEEVGVDINPAEVAGIDFKISSGEFSLRRQPEGAWEISGGVKDRADEGIVKELLSYCTRAQIKETVDRDEVKEGKVSAASLGLDDAGAWRVTWLKADGSKLAEVKLGKTAPLDSGSYVQVPGQESRPDIYIVSPDLRPLLARPPDSFRDPRVSRYPSEVLVKVVVRKGEGEVEFSRTFQQAKPAPGKAPLPTESAAGKTVIEMEPTPWVISRPLPNAPANQDAVNEFVAVICGAKIEAWVPYSETENAGEKPIVEVTVVPAGANTKGSTLAFFKDPADPDPAAATVKPGEPAKPAVAANPGAPGRMAICRDAQRKASFKIPRQFVDELCIAESPTDFRSRVLASVDPAIISTIHVEQTDGVSVEVVRVRDRWYWRPLKGGKFEEAAPEAVEKLITLLNTTQIVDYASDSLSDPVAFGLDKPITSITMAAGAHVSLEQLTPVDNHNSQTLRIGLTALNTGSAGPGPVVPGTQEKVLSGRFYANFTRDPFVFQIGPELPSRIPRSFFKWRSLTLPGFSMQQVRRIKQTIGPAPPVELQFDWRTSKFTASRAGADITSMVDRGAVETLVAKAGTLQAMDWLESGSPAARAALEIPAVRIDVEMDAFDGKPGSSHLAFEFAPTAAESARFCFGRVSGVTEPFVIQSQVLSDLSASLLRK